MSARKPPLLLRGGLTGRVYVVTSYVDLGDGLIEARTKHDVTDQFRALVDQEAHASTPAPARRRRVNPRALERDCPRCGAEPGQRCRRAGGAETGEPHAARWMPTSLPGQTAAFDA